MKCTLNKEGLQLEWLMFDFDNTLVDFHKASKLAFDQCFIDFGIEQKPDHYAIYEKINAKIWKDFEDKKITALDIRKQRFTQFLERIGIHHLDGLAYNAAYLENLIKFTDIRPEVKHMLLELKKKYKLSIITNGLKEVQRPRIEKCGITSLFDSIIVSDEIGVAKPDKAFFDLAMDSIQTKVNKSKILVIGDSVRSDMAGAFAYGLKSCFINVDQKENIKADIILDDVLELGNLLGDIYKPVDCGWYDYLEIYSMRKNDVEIVYHTDTEIKTVITKISTLKTKNKEEFAVLANKNSIRLDKIISISVAEGTK